MLTIYVWLGAALAAACLEVLSLRLICIYGAFGALTAALACHFGLNAALQFLIFAGTSVLLWYICQPISRRLLNRFSGHIASSIGSQAKVLSDMESGVSGRVELDGVDWPAVTDDKLHKNDICIVTGVKGNFLEVGIRKN